MKEQRGGREGGGGVCVAGARAKWECGAGAAFECSWSVPSKAGEGADGGGGFQEVLLYRADVAPTAATTITI